MKVPDRIKPLIHEGHVDRVITQLMSGKEATVYVVESGDKLMCAKIYKEANQRSFKHNSDYTEGRRVRNSRRSRAMEKSSRYGRQEREEAWQNTEVEAMIRAAAAGVRVPQIYNYVESVLLMELIVDEEGNPAPRLHDVSFTTDEARTHHQHMLTEIVRLLCCGMVHGDLSEYNVLFGEVGPVIIDFPQAVDAAGNNNASKILERDVRNMASFFGRFAPELISTNYGKEIWDLYRKGKLTTETKLTGKFESKFGPVNVRDVLQVIDDAREEAVKAAERKNS